MTLDGLLDVASRGVVEGRVAAKEVRVSGNVEGDVTVAALKGAIRESEALGAGVTLSLIFGVRKLDVDTQSLSEAGIEEGAPLVAGFGRRSGPPGGAAQC